MDDTINYLSAHATIEGLDGVRSTNATLGAKVGMLWLDIEGTQVRQKKRKIFLLFFFIIFFSYSTGPHPPRTTSTSSRPWLMRAPSVEFLLECILPNPSGLLSLVAPPPCPSTLCGMLTTTTTRHSLTLLPSAAGPSLPSSSTPEMSPSALLAGTRTGIKLPSLRSL